VTPTRVRVVVRAVWSSVDGHVRRPGHEPMMEDGNNSVNARATLKINWRAVVKDPRRARVAVACELVPL